MHRMQQMPWQPTVVIHLTQIAACGATSRGGSLNDLPHFRNTCSGRNRPKALIVTIP